MLYGYARVSTVEQATGTSLDEQERTIRAVAQALDPSADATLEMVTDPGVSGSVPFHERPGGGWLLDMLLPGDTVVVSKLDRAFRSAKDALAQAHALEERGVDLVLADMGPQPVTRDGVGRLFFTMMAALAEFERTRIAERTREGRDAKKARGGYQGGRPPFGWRKVGQGKEARLEEVPEQQKVLPVVAECRASGMSLRATADYVAKHHGVEMSYATVRRIEQEAEEEG